MVQGNEEVMRNLYKYTHTHTHLISALIRALLGVRVDERKSVLELHIVRCKFLELMRLD